MLLTKLPDFDSKVKAIFNGYNPTWESVNRELGDEMEYSEYVAEMDEYQGILYFLCYHYLKEQEQKPVKS